MNPPRKTPAASIRALARRLRLSPTTVSEALRGVPRVAKETITRVQAEATRHGYRYNPLAGAVLSEVRRSRSPHFRGTLGLLAIEETDLPPGADAFIQQLAAGATERSAELGFTLDRFLIGAGGLAATRLDGVLRARNIAGVLVLPSYMEAHLEGIDWSRLSAIYLDRVIRFPNLHSVSPDHHGAMWDALGWLTDRGYRRPGLVLQRRQDGRLQNRWEGAFMAFFQQQPKGAPVPPLVATEITEDMFRPWFRKHRPDVVLAHRTHVIGWMEKLGARVPVSHGFMALNSVMCDGPCAAIDQQPGLIGRRGAELLIGQILRGETGLPATPCNTAVPARVLDGPTIGVLQP